MLIELLVNWLAGGLAAFGLSVLIVVLSVDLILLCAGGDHGE